MVYDFPSTSRRSPVKVPQLGELARSENHTSSRSLAAELSELYEELQAIASDHGLPIY